MPPPNLNTFAFASEILVALLKLTVPLLVSEVNVPTLVILGCELSETTFATFAKLAVPDKLPIKVVAPTLPILALPVTLKEPPVIKLPPVILPVAVINPPVPKLPTLALALALIVVANKPVRPKLPTLLLPVPLMLPTNKLAPTLPMFAFPITLNAPPVTKLPPVIFPVAVIRPAVPILPMLALPVALKVLFIYGIWVNLSYFRHQ